MSNKELEIARKEAEQSATVWFAVLDHARSVGDFESAAKAHRQLELMGVTVTYTPIRPIRQREVSHA